MGGSMLLAVPLLDGDSVVGLIAALDKEGAEEFGVDDARLFEALGDELVLTLDSYRLFLQVTEERERFQRIFHGSKEGICLLGDDGTVAAWNPALERITGFPETDMIGLPWSDRVVIRDRDHQRIEHLAVLDIPPDEEVEVVTRTGPSRWISVVSGPVQTGRDKGWVVLVRDVTAEHVAEEAKGDFLATISHELRTPLTTIKGSLQVLSRPKSDPYSEVGQQMVSIMRRGTDRLERLLMNLLVVSQMETGDVQVFMDEVPMQDAVKNRIGTMLEDHPQVEFVAPDQMLIVRADRERLFQVIDHLLDNAQKFGGAETPIRIEVKHENGYAVLSVRDEGPGIAEGDQERIFERFTRLGHLLTRETQGAGVGLFIAKRSVEAMNGTIWVDSDPGRGSTFYARLPLARPMAVADEATTG
jgi:PAS domain S-box-containing protein